jgi:hypothetical protein
LLGEALKLSVGQLGYALFFMAITPVTAGDAPSLAGHSDASPEVIARIREMLDVFAPVYIQCAQATSVTAGVLPEDLVPQAEQIQIPAALVPGSKGSSRYELWTLGGCGHVAQIIIKLWYLDTGFETFVASPVLAPQWGIS